MKTGLILACIVGMTTTITAQQLELNSPGASLTRAGINPTPGAPFSIFINSTVDVQIDGNPAAPLILMFSALPLANPSNGLGGALGGQFLDLQTTGLTVLVDGFGGGTGLLPSSTGFLNIFGQANFSFPTSFALNGFVANFQGIVYDPSQPFGLNLTAAGSYAIGTSVTFSGDNVLAVYTLPFAPINVCGNTVTQLSVSTNGWITFNSATNSDPTETVGEMVTGNPGSTTIFSGSPLLAVMWEDLNMIGPAGFVTINQTPAGVINLSWTNGNYVATPPGVWGTNNVTIVDLGGGTTQITVDYTGFVHPIPPNEGLVGFSSGISGAPTTMANLSTAGFVNPFASQPGPINYFQTFDGVNGAFPGLAAGPFDLGGQIMNYFIASDCSIVVF